VEDNKKKRFDLKGLKNLVKLYKYLKPHSLKFGIGLVFLALSSGVALIIPALLGNLVDASKEADIETINKIGYNLMFVFLAQAIFSYFRIALFVEVTEKFLSDIRKDVYSKILTFKMDFFVQTRVGELSSRISSDITKLQEVLTTTSAQLIRQVIIIFGGIILLLFTSVKLTLILLSTVPLMALLAWAFGRYIRKMSKDLQDKLAESNIVVEETLQGIMNVKAFANEGYESKRYAHSIVEILDKAVRGGKARGAFASFIILCLFGAVVFLMWYGTKMVNTGEISIGVMFQYLLYSLFIGGSISGAAEVLGTVQKTIGSSERIIEILNTEGEIINFEPKNKIKKFEGDLIFKDVVFSYESNPDQRVLKGISFEIKKGEKLAIVGPSGAGKSTIVNLILRFYNPESGSILIDGKNIKEHALTDYRNQLAVVPQDVFLFGGSILDNIKYGNTDASFEEVVNAAKAANAFEFIDKTPQKFDTLVGERGIKLSGGQKQRIAIARAILKDPAILVLDEATSALDSESEMLVQEAFERLMNGRTSVIIAHRLSTIKNADKIIVIDAGKIIEVGTHDELLAIDNGLYKKLSRLQYQFA